MRILGDNSHGFQNEIDIEKSLNEKTYDKLNANLKRFLEDVFHGYNLKGKRIHAIRSEQRVKPDFYLHIDGIPKEVYVSVKKGSGNSVHQEKLSTFIDFLNQQNTPKEIIEFVKLYHYSDGTTDNTGNTRLRAREFSKLRPDVVDRLNEYFNTEIMIKKLMYRFVFTGNIQDAPTTDYLYHGTIHNGVWASREEIFKYLKEKCKISSSSFNIGPLTFQAWNKNLEWKPEAEYKRQEIQLKWGSMHDDLIKITCFRDFYKQNGTYEGEYDERSNVIFFNRNPNDISFKAYLSEINSSPEETLLVRVTTFQFSKLSNQKVKTRADAYAIRILNKDLLNILEENNFYLDETILENYTEYYTFIQKSGISIKLHNSDEYTLIKFTPNSFNFVFNSYALGATASLYCNNKEELPKNKSLINGWFTNYKEIKELNKDENFSEQDLYSSINICSKIKKNAIKIIYNKIENSESIQKLIFNGIGVYDEPYTAYFFMKANQITRLAYIAYNITTGSGRSKGKYTLILKPKKKAQNSLKTFPPENESFVEGIIDLIASDS